MKNEAKTLQELNLEDDFLFAKVMSDHEICKEFLEKLLDIEIEKIEMPSSQKVIDLLLDCKGIRLDIYVKDEKNTIYNIEMQRTDNKNLGKRMRYYQGNIDIDLIQKGEDYKELKKSYVIFICTFDYFNKGRHKYTFENVCLEDKNIKLKDDTQKIILNTKGLIDDIDDELLDFLRYVENSNEKTAESTKGTLVKHIHEKVIEVKKDKNVEVEFMTLLERDREKIEEGIQKGIQKGIQEATKKTAINLLKMGMTEEIISQATGLSIEQIKEIARNL
ncbi:MULTISPECIES: Rpn family recombination-promoting nuclease/putative transposase [Clostridium]|uniref:Rpn family recombination-promoting nuclease/putative transposase n=2 Tax=Clostridium butyricum TaxID=1492 RepID=A0AAP9UD30_CLOBU|nr:MULTISPECIES: Rpn family recombination-promoting nuclease/putative transposase [Clostridium]MBO1686791.1 Rpn family recombination-promoting nuclease/putative transposase [Clostridium butyricum]MBS4842072.1 Rpn family recombination-promoting nuclease/putative transposase [Clostridium sp.]MBZ5745762.1 Rpn family recombination-promoting nuclease/putative transposase [Clostridium butyricum]MCQ2016337.1 Rpn family recombination-promoting nuclease/putative transposase [Clostridium butyricum]MCQ20